MKQPERPKANATGTKAPKTNLPLMTPRNLVPATPMRFTGDNSDNSINSGAKPVGKVVKGPQRSGKEKSSVPLPPGYVDRAAQRRSGALEPEKFSLDIFEQADSKKVETTKGEDSESAKLKFLEESAGTLEFPSCKNVEIERLMNFILASSTETKIVSEAFRPNEAFLQFKSIEETKTLPFDPFHRPRKVFRASSNRTVTREDAENADEEVVDRVREAMARLKSATERNQKYLDTLAAASTTVSMSDDIFPDAGRFDERSVIDSVIKQQQESMHSEASSAKTKAKNRLFGSKKPQAQAKKEDLDVETEVDVFELIAQKSLDEKKTEDLDSASAGGLFGFSNILPKLSRLEDENAEKKGTKLSGVYASILSDNEAEGETSAERLKHSDDDDDKESGYMYPDSDDEDNDADVSKPLGNNKRKLARKEDKEAAKVEKLVKSKFGVDLSK